MAKADEQLSEAEAERRFKATLKRMLATPHKPHAKPKAKKTKSRRAGPKSA